MNKELIDHVWKHCLPKEFKEGVNKIYQDLTVDYDKYAKEDAWDTANAIYSKICILREVFGWNNLTSDAEGGDDEMLYVSRKQVQEQYALNVNALRKGNLTDMQTEIATKVKDTLYYLFGSKCLPDETKDETKEPKPAGPKFNLGNIVRFKYCCTTYRIDGFKMSDGVMLYQVGEVWAEESDLEPYTEPEKNIAENRNFSQDCDKHFDAILKDGFRNERRLNIAAQIMSGILSNQRMTNNLAYGETTAEGVVRSVVNATTMYTDALLAEWCKD